MSTTEANVDANDPQAHDPEATGSAHLLYTDVQEQLRQSVRELLTDRCSPADVLARCESDQPYDLDLWRTLAAEVGVAGLHVPEDYGGQGASVRETAVIAEELGRAVAPVPFLGSTAMATTALLDCTRTAGTSPSATGGDGVDGAGGAGSSASGTALLERLAAGTGTATLAVPLSMHTDAAFPAAVRATPEGTLTGRVSSVPDATVADTLIVPAHGESGPGLYAVDTSAREVIVTAATALDLTRSIADIEFTGAPANLVAGRGLAERALSTAMVTAAGILASEQLGIAQWCLDETISYVRQRYQFGRAIGSFQAIKHRIADLWLELVTARAAARYAADTLARASTDVPVAVATAQSYCSEVAVHAAEECIQLHGGIGMTWEHPAHLFLKRAKSDELALGRPAAHRATLGTLVDLPAS